MKKIISILLICVLVIFTGGCGEPKTAEPPSIVDSHFPSNNIQFELKTEVRNGYEIKYHHKKDNDNYYLFMQEKVKGETYSVSDYISSEKIQKDEVFYANYDIKIIITDEDSFWLHSRNVSNECGVDLGETFGISKDVKIGQEIDLSDLKLNALQNLLYDNTNYRFVIDDTVYSNNDKMIIYDTFFRIKVITPFDNIKSVMFDVVYDQTTYSAYMCNNVSNMESFNREWVILSYDNIRFNVINEIVVSNTDMIEMLPLKTKVNNKNIFVNLRILVYSSDRIGFYKQFSFKDIDGFDISQLDGQTLVFENVEGE